MLLPFLLQTLPLTYGEHSDPITDAKTYAAIAMTDGNSLAVACQNGGKIEVLLQTPHYLHEPAAIVGFAWYKARVDDKPFSESPWEVDDRHTAHVDGSRAVARFLSPLIDGKVLRLRIITVGEDSYDLTFNIEGAAASIAQVINHCDGKKIARRLGM